MGLLSQLNFHVFKSPIPSVSSTPRRETVEDPYIPMGPPRPLMNPLPRTAVEVPDPPRSPLAIEYVKRLIV